MQYTVSVTETRVIELIDAYGSDPAYWPAQERDTALAVLANSVALKAQQARHSELDEIIQNDGRATQQASADTQTLAQRILDGLPATPQHKQRSSAWRFLLTSMLTPRLAMGLATFMIVAVTVYLQIPADTRLANQAGAFEQWAWYEVTGQELTSQSNTAAMSMMDLIELEITEEDS